MGESASERPAEVQEGIAHRDERRAANERLARRDDLPEDTQGLVELACECSRRECERTVRVPLYVYRRMIESGDQYLLQAGHHAFERYRTIVSLGLVTIEERVR
jgi:hypothetical protein